MQITVQTFTVHKRFALTISRGTTSETTNIWITLEEDGIQGWGEASPFSIDQEEKKNTKQLLKQLEEIIPQLEKFSPWQREEIEQMLKAANITSSLRAAIDMALHDWLGKKTDLPLWRIWGLNLDRIVPISVTVGINSPEGARKRVRDWQELMGVNNPKIIKIKLGSPQGIEADRAMFTAVKQEAANADLTIDANGGWNLDEAIEMCNWLATQGVKYVEQPLTVGEENKLPVLYDKSPLPIFLDESCFNSSDIPRLAHCIHGINIKIMKTGGLSEAMRSIHVARACGLQIMFGCYSDSTLANTAMFHLAPLADYLDLDSHLNLVDDPFIGAQLKEGFLQPRDLPGLGVEYCGDRC